MTSNVVADQILVTRLAEKFTTEVDLQSNCHQLVTSVGKMHTVPEQLPASASIQSQSAPIICVKIISQQL